MAAVGLVLSAVGTVMQLRGQRKQTEALKEAEAQRQKQMQLEAQRQRRDTIRNMIMVQTLGISKAVNQGAGAGSSAIGGVVGQASGRAGNEVVGLNQNEQIGNNIFAANRKAYDASIISSFGAGLSSLGGTFMSDAGIFSRVGQTGWFGPVGDQSQKDYNRWAFGFGGK